MYCIKVTKIKYIMYKGQDYDAESFTTMLLTKLYVRVNILLTWEKMQE